MLNILTTKPFYMYSTIPAEYYYFFRCIIQKAPFWLPDVGQVYQQCVNTRVCVLKAEFRRGCCERHIPSGCRRLTCRWACSYQFQRLVAARRWERCGGSLRWLSGSEAYPSLQQEGRSQLRYCRWGWELEAEVVWLISSWYFSVHGRFQYFKLALKTISIFLNPFYKLQWWC